MWQAYCESNAGLVRTDNQDFWLAEVLPSTERGMLLCCVADGVGGHQAGNVASKLAVMTLFDAVMASLPDAEPGEVLKLAFETANSVVYRESGLSEALNGMGTTLTAILVNGSSATFCHIGDSRAYLLSSSGLGLLTQDHSVVQQLLSQGRISQTDAETHPQRHVLTKALGVGVTIRCDTGEFPLAKGDVLLLCTDGLTRLLSDGEIAQILGDNRSGADKAKKLIDTAMERGAPDNVTVVLAVWEGCVTC